jgi:hypothetical protein
MKDLVKAALSIQAQKADDTANYRLQGSNRPAPRRRQRSGRS